MQLRFLKYLRRSAFEGAGGEAGDDVFLRQQEQQDGRQDGQPP
jgi:hypothetical protein